MEHNTEIVRVVIVVRPLFLRPNEMPRGIASVIALHNTDDFFVLYERTVHSTHIGRRTDTFGIDSPLRQPHLISTINSQ